MMRGEAVNSIGTCADCGYHGPGPRHDCAKPPIPKWLDEVLAKLAVLDLHHADARRELAAALVAAAGADTAKAAQVIAETIRGSAEAVLKQKIATTQLKQHLLIDAEYSKHVAREIGNNAAGTVVLVLALGEDE